VVGNVSEILHLSQKFAHIFCTRAACRLISHRTYPFHKSLLKKSADCHKHKRNRAISADKVFFAACKRCVYHFSVYGIEHNYGTIRHTQGGGGVYPISAPAVFAKFCIISRRVIAALARYDNIHIR
jgi:hypothetical protein